MYNLQNTKDETSETIARNLRCLFPYIHDSMAQPTGSRSTFEFSSRVTFPVQACTVPSSMDYILGRIHDLASLYLKSFL